jgi:hypothetical protein
LSEEPTTGESAELRVKLADLGRKVENLDQVLTRIEKIASSGDDAGAVADGKGPRYAVFIPGEGGNYETTLDRSRRESAEAQKTEALSSGIRDRNMAKGYFGGLLAEVGIHVDMFEGSVLMADDLTVHVKNMKKDFASAGKKAASWDSWKKVAIAVAAIITAGFVMAALFQPADLSIFQQSLGSFRSQVIVVGVVVVLASAFLLDRYWKIRQARNPK